MKALLAVLLVAGASARAGEDRSCRVRAEMWEIGNPGWARALDTMASPEVWRQSLVLDPAGRLVGSWVVTGTDDARIAAGRERIYPVEYPSEVGLSPPPNPAPAFPQPPVTLSDFYAGWLLAKSHKEFEVRDEGWHFSVRSRESADGRWLLKVQIEESELREFVTYGFNPLAVPQPEFSRFSMDVTRSLVAGRWEILAAQQAPPRADGTRSGNTRVMLVRVDLMH